MFAPRVSDPGTILTEVPIRQRGFGPMRAGTDQLANGRTGRWSAYPPILSVKADILASTLRANSRPEQPQQNRLSIRSLCGARGCDPGAY